MALRIGQITYSNCAPLFFTLKKRHNSSEYAFIQGIPTELNKLISYGEIDISPSSSIEYAINPKEYLILPELSISSIGRVESILLFSRLPIERLNNKTIALTKASATSTVLLKILLKRLYNYSNAFVNTRMRLKDGLKRYHAYLLIGDDALRDAAGCEASVEGKNQNSGLYIYDLGKMWHKLTGKPFVFALWIVRKDAAISQKSLVARFYKDLLSSKAEAYKNLDKIAANIKAYKDIDSKRLIRYWKTISYDLDNGHIEGLMEFYRYAEKIGAIKMVPKLNFFEPAAD